MKILSGRINNWKSFPYKENPEWVEYGDLNIIIGANSHGKSNYLNAIRIGLFGECDYGGKTRPLETKDFYDSSKPIQIDFDIRLGEKQQETIRGEITLQDLVKGNRSLTANNNMLKGRLFPLGSKRIFYEWGHQEAYGREGAKNYQLASSHWTEIRNEFEEFFGFSLSLTPPKKEDLSDVTDETGTAIHEIGNGYVAVLFFMLELKMRQAECKVFLFEEPENHMHVGLQRSFLLYIIRLIESKQFQFFITTHSSVFIDTTLLNGVDSKVLHIKKRDKQSHVTPLSSKFEEKFDLLYKYLGYQPSQILLSNCIIWVEGPSDRIYLNKWIKDQTNELEEFKHYSIMFYGGNLLYHLTYDKNELNKFIELARLNVNSAMIFDSDATSNYEDEEPSSKLQTKKRIAKEIKKVGGFVWITKGTEIENYVSGEVFKDAVKKVHSTKGRRFKLKPGKTTKRTKFNNRKYINKVKVAQKVLELTSECKLEADADVKKELQSKIGALITWIKSVNKIPQ